MKNITKLKNNSITITISGIIITVILITIFLIVQKAINTSNPITVSEINYLTFANISRDDTKKYINTSINNTDSIKEIVSKLENGSNLDSVEITQEKSNNKYVLNIKYSKIDSEFQYYKDSKLYKQNAIVLFAFIPELEQIVLSENNLGGTGYLRYVIENEYKKNDLSYYLKHSSDFYDEVVNGNTPKFYIPDRIVYKNKTGYYIFETDDTSFNEIYQACRVNMDKTSLDNEFSIDEINSSSDSYIFLDYYKQDKDGNNYKPISYKLSDEDFIKTTLEKIISERKLNAFNLDNTKELELNTTIDSIPEAYLDKVKSHYEDSIYTLKIINARELADFETQFNVKLNDVNSNIFNNQASVVVVLSKYNLQDFSWNLFSINYKLDEYITDNFYLRAFIADKPINTNIFKFNETTYMNNIYSYITGTVTKVDGNTITVDSEGKYILLGQHSYDYANIVLDEKTQIYLMTSIGSSYAYDDENKRITYTNLDANIQVGDVVTVFSNKVYNETPVRMVANNMELVRKDTVEKNRNELKGKTKIDGSITKVDVDSKGNGTILFQSSLGVLELKVTSSTKTNFRGNRKLSQDDLYYYGITTVTLDSPIDDIDNIDEKVTFVDIYDG